MHTKYNVCYQCSLVSGKPGTCVWMKKPSNWSKHKLSNLVSLLSALNTTTTTTNNNNNNNNNDKGGEGGGFWQIQRRYEGETYFSWNCRHIIKQSNKNSDILTEHSAALVLHSIESVQCAWWHQTDSSNFNNYCLWFPLSWTPRCDWTRLEMTHNVPIIGRECESKAIS